MDTDPPQSKSPSLSQPPTSQNNEAISIPNGKSSQPDEPANRASEKTVANASQTEITDKSPRNRPSLAASSVHEQNATEVNTGTEAAGKNNSAGTQEQPRALRSGPEATEEPKSQSTKPARGRPPKVSRQEQPGEDVQREGKRKKQQTDAPQQAKDNGNKTAKHNRPRSNRTSISPSGQRPTEPTATNARRRHDSSGVPETDREQHNDTIQAIQAQTAEDVAEEVENETQNKSSIAQQNTASKPKRGRGRPSLASKAAEARNEQQKAPTGPEHTAGEPSAAAARRGRKKKAEPPREAENVSPELEEEQEPEPEAEAPSHKTRRGRPSKKPRRTVEREPSPATEQQDTEPVSPTRRKTREPRGETVPVTVHRLANVSALGAMYADADGSADEDEESADELSTRQKTKLPNRGGVNPADVLSQICRETLEKTLTTLKNGIANETNATRRAEWTRKRKAVEAFGSELDGRLLDLSEMLDSNFVLGVQLKKAKREMLDLRSHLYKVRQERDEIALQMDAVRAKHMEEESAKTVSSTAWLAFKLEHTNELRPAQPSTIHCTVLSLPWSAANVVHHLQSLRLLISSFYCALWPTA